MTRMKHRPDDFIHHGDRYHFHRLQDGPTLARLDPYCEEPQRWRLHSGRVVDVTGADVRRLALELNDQEIPATRTVAPGEWNEARVLAIEDRLAALEASIVPSNPDPCLFDPPPPDELLAARERIKELEALVHPKFPMPDERLSAWGDVAAVPAEFEILTPPEADSEIERILNNQAEGFDVADEIDGLSAARREELTHALHRKKGRMRRERKTGAAPQAEEAAIDHLVGLLARRGV